ncbi:MAG: hypothetical protein Q9192_007989, partial [Flavoplaca navasiana]
YEIYYELLLGGIFSQQVEKLHQRYGPIIRINPFELHINDPEYYTQIYNFDRHLEKRDFHIQNIQHTGSHSQHRSLRRALEPHLSRSAIQRLEPLLTQHIENLCLHLSSAHGRAKPLKLSHLYRCMTADIITSYTLGDSYDLLGTGDKAKSEGFLEAFQFTFRLLWLLREIPYLGVMVRWLGKGVGRWCGGLGILGRLLRWQWVRNFLVLIEKRFSQSRRVADKLVNIGNRRPPHHPPFHSCTPSHTRNHPFLHP